jgi:hypothetical protein
VKRLDRTGHCLRASGIARPSAPEGGIAEVRLTVLDDGICEGFSDAGPSPTIAALRPCAFQTARLVAMVMVLRLFIAYRFSNQPRRTSVLNPFSPAKNTGPQKDPLPTICEATEDIMIRRERNHLTAPFRVV